jgi:hypothetical protein
LVIKPSQIAKPNTVIKSGNRLKTNKFKFVVCKDFIKMVARKDRAKVRNVKSKAIIYARG